MRPPKSNLIYADFIVQLIMHGIIIFCAFLGLGGGGAILVSMFTLLPLGVWQIFSSLYTNLYLRIKSRQLHLVLTIAFFVFGFLIYVALDIFRPRMEMFGFIILGFVTAEIIAIYYTRITYLDYHKYLRTKNVVSVKKDLDGDILDAEMVVED